MMWRFDSDVGCGDHRIIAVGSVAEGELRHQDRNPGQDTAVFARRNSMSVFSHFQKRFARQGAEVAGYNVHPLAWLIGPGYFTVEPGPPGMPLRFDYRRVPTAAPAGWPRVSDNSSAFARPVFGGLLDEVAWVTADVLIGSAFRGERALGSYFILARAAA